MLMTKMPKSGHSAFRAMEESVEFDKTVNVSQRSIFLKNVSGLFHYVFQMILNHPKFNKEETLIIVTADHSHAVTMSGYPERGTNDLGEMGKSHGVENDMWLKMTHG